MADQPVEASRRGITLGARSGLADGTACAEKSGTVWSRRPYSRCLRGTVSVITICQSSTAESGRRPRDKAAARNSLPLQKPGFSEKPGFFTRPPVTDFLPRTDPNRTAEPATFFHSLGVCLRLSLRHSFPCQRFLFSPLSCVSRHSWAAGPRRRRRNRSHRSSGRRWERSTPSAWWSPQTK